MPKCPKCESTEYQRRGFQKGQQRLRCSACGNWYSIEPLSDKVAIPKFVLPKAKIKKIQTGQRFVVTTALNNTPVYQPFWESLLRYVKDVKATLIVIPSRYYNPAGRFAKAMEKYEYEWPAEVLPYLVENELQLNKHLRVLGHIRISPTASNPLGGLEMFGGGDSIIVAHPQIAMETVATPQADLPKLMHTTGTVSQKQYTDSKIGWKGDKHHSFGAVVVENSQGAFHMRVVNGDDNGGFYDLNRYFTPDGITVADHIPALITGDEHARFRDESVVRAVYTDKDSMVNTLRPKKIVRHDVFDGYSCSPHHSQDPITRFAKWRGAASNVFDELTLTVRHIEETTPKDYDCENIIVASNHHDFLRRWLCNADPKRDPENALIYHQLMAQVLALTDMGPGGAESPDPFALWAKKVIQVETVFLDREDHVIIEGILISLHGDRGSGGARGSRVGFAKIGPKTVVGHSHAPGIKFGCYQVGTSAWLILDYTRGAPSAHFHTMCAILPNGKRQLYHVVKGKWRL